MNEREFLIELRKRGNEQQQLMYHMPFPHIFTTIAEWLGNHPWRFLIPLALLLTIIFRSIFGPVYDDFILRLFSSL